MAAPKITKYDVFVIGGGSAGSACAIEAARNGKKVGLADFSKPSPKGSKWGTGGTCINVGCNTFRLMACSSYLGLIRSLQKDLGYEADETGLCSWKKIQEINARIVKKNSWGSKSSLSENFVRYYNKWAQITGPNTIELTLDRVVPEYIHAEHIVIATGTRPKFPSNLEGIRSHLLTSDDLCHLKEDPKNTLIIGGGFISVEVGSFLAGLGKKVTVLCRSKFLRAHDVTAQEKIKGFLTLLGANIIENIRDYSITVKGDKFLLDMQEEIGQEFDSVLVAIGRESRAFDLFSDKFKVLLSEDGKVVVDENDCTSAPGIYAIGDCASQRPCFSTPSKKAGILLGKRLADEGCKEKMSYDWTPYSLFTGLFEFSSIGMTEQNAIDRLGKENVGLWLQKRNPLAESLFWGRFKDFLFLKVVYSLKDSMVLGVHLLGEKSSELLMGYAIALRHGITLEDFQDSLVVEEEYLIEEREEEKAESID